MTFRSRLARWGALASVGLAACGGGDTPADAGAPASQDTAGARAAAAVQDTAPPAAQQQAQTELVREAFAYRGAGRNPFLSLVRSGAVRPNPQDLRVRAINFDPRYPQRSVATIQDTTMGRRYNLRVGDQVGRVRITQIRENEVVITIEEFGVERQVVLPIRRRREANTP